MIDKSLAGRPWVLSYPGLRRSGGYLGIALPFVLGFGPAVYALVTGMTTHLSIEPSISSYYHTAMRNLFVGDLCAIAVFLISCKGYNRIEAILGDLAGLWAMGVALFPTNGNGAPETLISKLHAVFASLLFLELAIFCLVLFTRTSPDKRPTPRKIARNTVYMICGYTIVVCIVLSLLTAIPSIGRVIGWKNHLFWYESVAIVSFGVAWITKGGRILKDRGVTPRSAVAPDLSADLDFTQAGFL